ncbi:hypothetical protein ABE29_10115 [Cytobacillus firmus]|nr:hypothetical protein [Cytobacillus firmus]MBG9552433.1 hypothetical protein [Cytobacillus firmus]MBG9558906.1 hypothetical protein [Cytobacillus firmus]MBG9575489.1 hypothetical protein [Cytobacillus firmus]
MGHRKAEPVELSQNPVQVRTQKGGTHGFESEPWVNFGHRKGEPVELSQNLGQVRTQKAGNSRPESEPGTTLYTES